MTPANVVSRLVAVLGPYAKALWLPLTLLSAADALTAALWLHAAPMRLFGSLVVTLPAQAVLALAAISLGARWLRLAFGLVMVVVSYAQYAFWSYYGRFLGSSEMRLAAGNSPREMLESIELYFSGPALAAALLTLLAYGFILTRSTALAPSRIRLGASVLALALWAAFGGPAGREPALYAPVPAFAAAQVHWVEERVRAVRSVRPGRLAAPTPAAPPADFDIVYLIGESIRADRLKPHAYARDVAPRLHALTLPHVTFNNVTSHGDCTGRSVPMLMVEPSMPLNRELYRRPTLFAYARQAGYHTAFLNSNENDWHEFVDPSIDVLYRNIDPAGGEDEWTFRTDAALVPVIARLANAPGRQFLVIETYTSHWPYGDRYETCPECRVYRPDLVHKAVSFSSAHRTKITNSYDNAIIYFDRFVSDVLAALHKPTLVILTSDHGESLGDENRWGHCSAGIEQMLVPLELIATDEAVARAAGFADLAGKADVPVAHANIFPTVLRWLGYDASRLDFAYATDLASVPIAGAAERQVLVSEYGVEVDAVTFSYVSRERAVLRQETEPSR